MWDEVKDRLGDSALKLSGGQQQRLCIARSLAVDPLALLLDEPCSSLDPKATRKIEDLLEELKAKVPILIVTHDMFQASRIADKTAFFTAEHREGLPDPRGILVEFGPTKQIFGNPQDKRTEAYVTGKLE